MKLLRDQTIVILHFINKDLLINCLKAEYGLAASVFTKNIDNALQISNSLRAGTVWVNCYDNFDAAAPFGGKVISLVTRALF